MKNYRKAFTLAEVLITLAIIGVVAALTVPTLIQNYQKRAIVTALQKNIALLDAGFRKMMADDGVDYITRTTWFSTAGIGLLQENPILSLYFKSEYGFPSDNYSVLPFEEYTELFHPVCQQYENVDTPWDSEYIAQFPHMAGSSRPVLTCTGGYKQESQGWKTYEFVPSLQANSETPRTFVNGAVVWFGHAEYYKDLAKIILIDVNGTKGPNKYGYDIQKLGLKLDGHVVPMNIDATGDDEYNINGGSIGAKRIKDDGWKITY